ncbi:MAG: general secretion pathway protein GspK [Candidatus Omnitrophica bacterium]|nr:general secretion pathway protein GspK [Candidatus Omnitrophota bacterium]
MHPFSGYTCGRERLPLKQSGAVLIFVLWVFTFLAVLAVNLGYGVRQKIIFLKRIESRSQAQHVTEGCAKAAVAMLLDDLNKSQYQYTPAAKAFRHNNPNRFADITVPDGKCEVSYVDPDGLSSKDVKYGTRDEESKININTADKTVLFRIVSEVLGVDDHLAETLSEAIYDWRQAGESELKGFSSDDYYSNLKDPYPKKSQPFEIIDELMLVKGIDSPSFELLRDYLTVYGAGQVNINMACKKVILALGLDEEVVDRILALRRGADGVDNTSDDHIFSRTFDIAAEVNAYKKLEPEQMKAIDYLNQRNLLGTNSSFFTIRSLGFLNDANDQRHLYVTISSTDNRILYWNEK